MTGVLDQLEAGKIGQALVAQKNIEGVRRPDHMLHRAFGTVGGGQLSEAVTLEQALGRPELKGVIFYQQDAQIVFEHRITHASSVEYNGV
ncbi:hypothetical protein D3C86_1645260 [compost metagenome]